MFIELFLLNWTLWFKKFVINSKKKVLMWAKSIKLSSFCNSTLRQLNFFCKVLNAELTSAVVYKFHCGLCNEFYYGKSIRYLDKRSGEHIGVSPLTGKNVKLSNNSAICDHLLHCFSKTTVVFSLIETKSIYWKMKESLLIMRDKPSLNRYIDSAPLYLFAKVS